MTNPTPMSDEREAFEAWAKEHMQAGATNGLSRKESGEYLWSGTAFAWSVWQAARAQPPSAQPSVGVTEQELAKILCGDDEVWELMGRYPETSRHNKRDEFVWMAQMLLSRYTITPINGGHHGE